MSVHPFDRPQQRRAAGLLLSAGRQEVSIGCCTARRVSGVGAQQQRRRSTAVGSTALSSKCRQCLVDS